jgi:hypothetical protein
MDILLRLELVTLLSQPSVEKLSFANHDKIHCGLLTVFKRRELDRSTLWNPFDYRHNSGLPRGVRQGKRAAQCLNCRH